MLRLIYKIIVVLIILLVVVIIYNTFQNDTTIEFAQGFWKPDNVEIETTLNSIKTNIPNVTIEGYDIIRGMSIEPKVFSCPFVHVPSEPYGGCLIDVNMISKEDARNRAIMLIDNYHTFFKSPSSEVKITKVEFEDDKWLVRFEPQKYKNINICNGRGGEMGVTYNVDGSLYVATSTFYPNLTAPTQPKLTDRELITKYLGWPESDVDTTRGVLCIFPKWHPDGEYWTYHLAKDFKGNIVDTWSGEILFQWPIIYG